MPARWSANAITNESSIRPERKCERGKRSNLPCHRAEIRQLSKEEHATYSSCLRSMPDYLSMCGGRESRGRRSTDPGSDSGSAGAAKRPENLDADRPHPGGLWFRDDGFRL